MDRTITVGDPLFEFDSKQHWVNKGRSWYATCGYRLHEVIALDAIGRVVVSGKEFMRAEDEGTYPVTVYPIDPLKVADPSAIDRELARRFSDDATQPESASSPRTAPEASG